MPMRPDLVESLSASTGEGRKLSRKERRKAPRKETIRVGVIIYGTDRRMMYCALLNMSHGGAKLTPTKILDCPDRFSLAIADQPTRNCEVIWREHSEVGVKFL